MSDDEGFMHNNSENDDNDLFEEDDLIAFQRSKVAASDLVPFEADNDLIDVEQQQQQAVVAAANSSHLVPYSIVPTQETNAVRPEYAVVDNVAFYNHVSLLALTYGQATQGIKAGAIFDAKEQRMKEQQLRFDF